MEDWVARMQRLAIAFEGELKWAEGQGGWGRGARLLTHAMTKG